MEERVKRIISEYQQIPISEINLNSRLLQDIGLSSFDIIGLVCNFEKEFNINIPDKKIVKIRTVEDIVNELKTIIKE